MSTFILGILIFFQSCNMKQGPVYTELHPNVYAINNQFFYGEKVHTYLLELEDKVLLFDLPTYSREVEEFITSFGKPAYAIISHGSCGIADGTKWQEKIRLKVYAHKADENHPWLRMEPDVFFEEIPKFGENVQVIHTPGHSAGAICVLEKNSKSLFTGDTFYGDKNGKIRNFTQETPENYESPADRLASCKMLLRHDFENVYPFHYEFIEGNGRALLRNYLKGK